MFSIFTHPFRGFMAYGLVANLFQTSAGAALIPFRTAGSSVLGSNAFPDSTPSFLSRSIFAVSVG
jgi:hypothetical protein